MTDEQFEQVMRELFPCFAEPGHHDLTDCCGEEHEERCPAHYHRAIRERFGPLWEQWDAAYHALRSYEYGNTSPDLARELAFKMEQLRKALDRIGKEKK